MTIETATGAASSTTNPDLAAFATEGAGTLEEQLGILLELRKEDDRLEAEAKRIGEAKRNAERDLLSAMAAQGLASFKALGYSATAGEGVYPSVLAADRPRMIEWLRENGRGDMVQETVNSTTFAGYIRNEVLPSGEPVPEFVRIAREPKLSLRKSA
jgi:hypothetical protein